MNEFEKMRNSEDYLFCIRLDFSCGSQPLEVFGSDLGLVAEEIRQAIDEHIIDHISHNEPLCSFQKTNYGLVRMVGK